MGAAIALGAMLATRVVEACSSESPRGRGLRGGGARRAAWRFDSRFSSRSTRGCTAVLVRAGSDLASNAPFIFGAKRGTELTATGSRSRDRSPRARVVRRANARCWWRAATSESRRRDESRVFVSRAVSAAVGAAVFLAPWPRVALRRGSSDTTSSEPGRDHERARSCTPDSNAPFFLGAHRRGVAKRRFIATDHDRFLPDDQVGQTAALRDAATVAIRAVVVHGEARP